MSTDKETKKKPVTRIKMNGEPAKGNAGRKAADISKYDMDNLTDWQERKVLGYQIPKSRPDFGPVPKLPPTRKGREALLVREKAQEQTSRAIQLLMHIAENGRNESARVAALREILDRGWGKSIAMVEDKPVQSTRIEVILPNGNSQIVDQVIDVEPNEEDDC